MAAKSKSTVRPFTPEERARYQQALREVEEDLPEIKERMWASLRREERVQELLLALRAARFRAGHSLDEIDEETGIGWQTLAAIDHGMNADPTIGTLLHIAEVLGVELRIELDPPAEGAASAVSTQTSEAA